MMTLHLCDILFASLKPCLDLSQSVPTQRSIGQRQSVSIAFYHQALRLLGSMPSGQGLRQAPLQTHHASLIDGLFYFGLAYFNEQDFATAHVLWDLTACLLDEVGNQHGEAKALYYAGLAAYYQGDDEQAVICLEHARILNLVLDQVDAEDLTLTWLGHAYTRQQHTKMAMCCYWDAGTLCQQRGDRLGELLNYAYLGYVFELEEMPLSALDTYRQAIALLQMIDSHAALNDSMLKMAEVMERAGEMAEALDCYRAVIWANG